MNRREKRIAKKIIRFRLDTEWMYNLDKIFKITKVKIVESRFKEDIEGGKLYRVKYKYGLNLINPLSWIIVIIPILAIAMFDAVKDILEDLGSSTYSDDVRIRSK